MTFFQGFGADMMRLGSFYSKKTAGRYIFSDLFIFLKQILVVSGIY